MASSTHDKYPLFSSQINDLDVTKVPPQLHQLIEAARKLDDAKYVQNLIPPGYYHIDDPSCPGPVGSFGYEGPGRSYADVRNDSYRFDMLEFAILFTVKLSKEQKDQYAALENQFKLTPSGSNYGSRDHPYRVLSVDPATETGSITCGLYGLPGYHKFVEARRERLGIPELTVLEALEDNHDEDYPGISFGNKYYDPYWCEKLPITEGNPEMRIHEAGEVKQSVVTPIPETYKIRLHINGVDLEQNLPQLIALVNELSSSSLPEVQKS
jgi:hypothetical protein